jgi:hypothetical protein
MERWAPDDLRVIECSSVERVDTESQLIQVHGQRR